MVRVIKQRKEKVSCSKGFCGKVMIVILVITVSVQILRTKSTTSDYDTTTISHLLKEASASSSSFRSLDLSEATIDYDVDDACKNLPSIRPSGTYFLDEKVKPASSPEGVSPSFHIGSYFADKVTYHMLGDKPHFDLIKELLQDKPKGGLTLDIGANQGFYTYYLAALGMEVHAFEIFQPNYVALYHGAEFNPREISERVHVYPVGLSSYNGRMRMGGSQYEGHLKKEGGGPILTVSFDCFAYHNLKNLGSKLISDVAFVKLDVEGFEIAVLQGAKKSLFGKKGNVGGMLMEVGPDRWSRAGIDFPTGLQEMKELSTHFKSSYVILRTGGSYMKSCPASLAQKTLSDKNPRKLGSDLIYVVRINEWEPLLSELNSIKGDCNFWYTN